MEPIKTGKTEQNRKKVTIGVIALSMASLLAGASVAATLEEYAAPVYAETDPFEGAVDDLTGEDTWQEKEMDAKPMGKHIRKAMKSRMNDRMEDRTEHLEKRVEIDLNLIMAFQFCLDSENCTAKKHELSEMIEKLTLAIDGMQAKLDGTDSVNDGVLTDKEEDNQLCMREENGTYYYDCGDDKYKDWDERKDWEESDRLEFAEEKATELAVAHESIIFCLENENCSADSAIIRTALGHMTNRAEHHIDCTQDQRCDRDHDKRKGLRGRMSDMFCKMLNRCEQFDEPLPAPHIEITQEICESRMGTWTEAVDRGEGVFFCDLSDQSDEAESDTDRDRDDDEADNPDNQEECEAIGGTWYEERQYCQSD